jgi:hypothetical protein
MSSLGQVKKDLATILVKDVNTIILAYLLPKINDIIVQQSLKEGKVYRNYFYLVVRTNQKYMQTECLRIWMDQNENMVMVQPQVPLNPNPLDKCSKWIPFSTRKVTWLEFWSHTHVQWVFYDPLKTYFQPAGSGSRIWKRKKN